VTAEIAKPARRRKKTPQAVSHPAEDFETLRDWTCFDADGFGMEGASISPRFSNWKVLADGHMPL